MPTQPSTLTWVVIEERGVQRALCVQASSPSRVRKFLRLSGDVFAVERGYGEDHHGQPLKGDNRRRLARSLQRHASDNGSAAMTDAIRVRARIDAELARVADRFGVKVETLIKPSSRCPKVARARTCAAHDLRHNLDLKLEEIAKALHLKHHSAVRYLLTKPRPEPEESP